MQPHRAGNHGKAERVDGPEVDGGGGHEPLRWRVRQRPGKDGLVRCCVLEVAFGRGAKVDQFETNSVLIGCKCGCVRVCVCVRVYDKKGRYRISIVFEQGLPDATKPNNQRHPLIAMTHGCGGLVRVVAGDEDVARLDVEVVDAALVEKVEPVCRLDQEIHFERPVRRKLFVALLLLRTDER